MGVEGGLVALQSLLTVRKGTSPFKFQSNESFLKVLKQQIAISKFISDAFQENTRFRGGGIHTPITLNLKKGTKTSD